MISFKLEKQIELRKYYIYFFNYIHLKKKCQVLRMTLSGNKKLIVSSEKVLNFMKTG